MPPRILVVEDEKNVAYVVTTALRLAGFDAVGTENGREALALVSDKRSYDLVILDVMLPDLDGFEVCRRMRFEGIDIPVMFLTAADAVEDRVRGLTIGGDDYLTKPFSVEEFVAQVQVIFRRSGASETPQLMSCADLVLDDDAHVVPATEKLWRCR